MASVNTNLSWEGQGVDRLISDGADETVTEVLEFWGSREGARRPGLLPCHRHYLLPALDFAAARGLFVEEFVDTGRLRRQVVPPGAQQVAGSARSIWCSSCRLDRWDAPRPTAWIPCAY